MKKLQTEVEIKISELDKLLDDIQKKHKTSDNRGTNSKIKSLHKTQ